MSKPTYYLWRTDFISPEQYNAEKAHLMNLGFRVVTFIDGREDNNIHDALKEIIRNHHLNDSS